MSWSKRILMPQQRSPIERRSARAVSVKVGSPGEGPISPRSARRGHTSCVSAFDHRGCRDLRWRGLCRGLMRSGLRGWKVGLCPRLREQSGHNPVLFLLWTEEKRGACEWFKILNWEYSQMQGREKLFERERHGTCCRIGFLHVSL